MYVPVINFQWDGYFEHPKHMIKLTGKNRVHTDWTKQNSLTFPWLFTDTNPNFPDKTIRAVDKPLCMATVNSSVRLFDGGHCVTTTAHFEHKVITWANKRLNKPKPLTWAVDIMVSEFFLSYFMNLWEQMILRAWRQPIWIGRIYVVNHNTLLVLLHTKYRSCGLHGFRRFLKLPPW